ncbi:hypothetical protein [Sphingobium yanoikuyae]|uniref:hypothetical protein n=1 Tax=Sphingobium yanoikuyae TaxID=13690 RepID=UPI00242E2DCD|nr:hypothetical protein [Sphingobium yanoikuyae]
MNDLTTKIGPYNADTQQVSVTFTSGDIVHKREVNAVLKASGAYDKAATAARVSEVATGVAVKIGLGVIKVAPPVIEPDPQAQDADTSTAETAPSA